MLPRDVKTAADARQIVESRGMSHVKVGVFDMDGIMRGKYMSREKFFGALDKGFGFCDVVLDGNHTLAHCDAGSGSHPPHPLLAKSGHS